MRQCAAVALSIEQRLRGARRPHRRAARVARARLGGARRLALRRRAARARAAVARTATACAGSRIPRCALPAGWPAGEARLELDLGGEGLLTLRRGRRAHRARARPRAPGVPGRRRAVRDRGRDRRAARVRRAQPRRAAGARPPRVDRRRARAPDPAARPDRARRPRARRPRGGGGPPTGGGAGRADARAPERDPALRLARPGTRRSMRSVWELPRGLDPHPPALDDEERALGRRGARARSTASWPRCASASRRPARSC